MSFRQILDRIARIARAEAGSRRNADLERELRRAQELIDESRRPRRTTIEADDSAGATAPDPEYLRACRTLGVEPGASAEKVAEAYRARARKYHPDRVAHLSPDEQQSALRQMQELNLAYELLRRRSRG